MRLHSSVISCLSYTKLRRIEKVKRSSSTLATNYSSFQSVYSHQSIIPYKVIHRINRVGTNQIYKVQKRNLAYQDDDTNSFDKQQTSSSSSTHQQYNRKAYEQKRKNCDQERNSNQNRSLNIFSNLNHYQRLNVDINADMDTIKSAYYSLSKQYHPDIVGPGNPGSTENFRMITESYDILSDISSRETYDRELNLTLNSKLDIPDHIVRTRNPNSANNPLYRTKNADILFRQRQEAALAREKYKNPEKFRAGVFRKVEETTSSISGQEQLANIQRRLGQIKTHSSKNDMDGSDFYRIHLYDTMKRRESGLRFFNEHENSSPSYKAHDALNPVSILATSGAVLAFLMIGIICLVDFDLPEILDNKLENSLKDKRKE